MASIVVALAALALAACGEGSQSNAGEPEADFRVQVVDAGFPAKQRLGQTSRMRVAIRNAGRETIPALTVYVSVAGKAGQRSFLPFGYRNPQPGLAQPDRPVWVLAARYPKADGATVSRGGEGSNRKTFDFGPLDPGRTLKAVWKVTAVKQGKYAVLYEISAGLGGKAKAETNGTEAGGSFSATISAEPPDSEVTDSGEVVEIGAGSKDR